jgi:phosphate transport system ATP-binding protein
MPNAPTHPPSLKLVQSDNPQLKDAPVISLKDFSAYYGENCILSDIHLSIPSKGVTCLIGPSGAGKSTLLRTLNRIHENAGESHFTGEINILGRDLVSGFPDVTELRRRVGMVFQTPCVFPMSIADNVTFGLRGTKLSKGERRDIVAKSLKSAALWDEVSRRLDQSAMSLSLGQQQRLCIARALAMSPEILLLDEPTASVDPISARAIEDLLTSLSKEITIIMVTHNIGQTKRIADHVAFICDGHIVESGEKHRMFSKHSSDKTRTYLTEEFCDC